MESEFVKKLSALLNEHSKENSSNTPDFILAEFLNKVLMSFDHAVNHRSAYESQRETSKEFLDQRDAILKDLKALEAEVKYIPAAHTMINLTRSEKYATEQKGDAG